MGAAIHVAGADGDGTLVSKLDGLDEDMQNAKFSGAARASLHMKLARNAGIEVPEETRRTAVRAGLAAAPLAAPGAPSGSRCVVLKNMFDRLSEEAQSRPNFFDELANDVRGECSRFGTVLFAGADRWSNGFVYVKMLSDQQAERVVEVMHGRYFDKNKVLASFVAEDQLDKKFSIAKF